MEHPSSRVQRFVGRKDHRAMASMPLVDDVEQPVRRVGPVREMAHFNAIVGWLSLLRRDHTETRDFQEGLKVIDRNTRAQLQLIDEGPDVSRMVSVKLRVDIHPCELADVINVGVNVMRPAAEARGITLNVQLDPSASGAWCDSARIQQVAWNLVSNAVKFTLQGRTSGRHATAARRPVFRTSTQSFISGVPDVTPSSSGAVQITIPVAQA